MYRLTVPSASSIRRTLKHGAKRALKPWLPPDFGTFDYTQNTSVGPLPGEDAAIAFNGRPMSKWRHYFQVYDEILGPTMERVRSRSGQPINLLEIGVQRGGSLDFWRSKLGPDAVITGVDIDPSCLDNVTAPNRVLIGSQSDREFLARIARECGPFDVIVDDGSHVMKDIRTSFQILFAHLNAGGIYVIEDVHTAYWWGWGGGYRRPGSIIEYTKGLIDGMHQWYYRAPRKTKYAFAAHSIFSVKFYDSVIVITKQQKALPQFRQYGAPRESAE